MLTTDAIDHGNDRQLASCIYEGVVAHRRFTPIDHSFNYRLFMLYLDLDEIDVVFRNRWFWSTRRAAVARFQRSDHFGDPQQTLADSVRDEVWNQLGVAVRGPIRLLTHLRYFGYVINPVSFYYCFDKAGERVEAVLAEVTNTPWGETHCYAIPGEALDSANRFEHAKDFHVSPFMPMDMSYQWQISSPRDELEVSLANHKDGERVHSASLTMSRLPITGWNLATRLMRHPLVTLRVVQGIYWQALRLKLKGMPFYSHPNHGNPKTDTFARTSERNTQ